jgi:hypothetical protein
MSGVKQVEFRKPTPCPIHGEPPVLRYRREPKEVEPLYPLICPTSGSMGVHHMVHTIGLGINQVVISRNEKFFKTNTRNTRKARNTHGHLLYPLVFFRLKKRNGKIEENYRNTRKARNTRNTYNTN